MRVRKVSSNDVKLYDLTQVKLKTAGNTQVVQFTAGNNKSCPVRNLSKDEYLDKKTGEVKSILGENGTTNDTIVEYFYDNVGNLTKKVEDGVETEYTYNNLNQLQRRRFPWLCRS